MKYIIDANFFIKAHQNHYAFDIVPAFWDHFSTICDNKDITLIQPVYDEITKSNDVLSEWSKKKFSDSCIKVKTTDSVTEQYSKIIQWAYNRTSVYDSAKEVFANSADPWLVAYAIKNDAVVITNETSAPGSKKNIKLADVCNQFSVDYMNDINFLREISLRIE